MLRNDKLKPPFSQLPLPFSLEIQHTFETFYAGKNKPLLRHLEALTINHMVINPLYFWGHQGVGCSHLLQACCHQAKQNNIEAIYISLKAIPKEHHIIYLQQLVNYQIVCIDDLAIIAGDLQKEEALFHAYNALADRGASLVMAAHQVPKQLNFKLLDLTSRLESGLLFQVQSLTDQEKVLALQLRANLKGFSLTKEVGQFLLARLIRNTKALFTTLDQLEQSSLVYQRKLTIPFVKEILKL